MFFSPSAILAFFFTLFIVGQAAAAPRPMPMMGAIERSVKRQGAPSVQTPSKSDGNTVVVYKRQGAPSVQTPSKSDGNAVVVYKRQDAPNVQTPAKSDGTNVTPYKRHDHEEIPSQLAVRSVDGLIELY